jgi:hypothetical protein
MNVNTTKHNHALRPRHAQQLVDSDEQHETKEPDKQLKVPQVSEHGNSIYIILIRIKFVFSLFCILYFVFSCIIVCTFTCLD